MPLDANPAHHLTFESLLRTSLTSQLVSALGLLLNRPSGNATLFAGSMAKFTECIAAFLTFPAHGTAHIFHPRELESDYYDVNAYDAFGIKKVVR